MLVRMWSTDSSYASCVGGYNGRIILENSSADSYKIIHIPAMSLLSRVRLFVTSWTVADQAPPSMGFSRQEYWSGLPFPSPGDYTCPKTQQFHT